MATNKTRLAQLEKQKPQVKITWKDFVDWMNGEVFDADTEARLQQGWDKRIAEVEAELTAMDKEKKISKNVIIGCRLGWAGSVFGC